MLQNPEPASAELRACEPAKRTYKQQGEITELAFLLKASELGFAVTQPYGDSEPYDFALDSGSRFWRVQVKSTHSRRRGSYFVCTTRNRRSRQIYTPDQIDFVVAHTEPDTAWYIIPICALATRMVICLYPHTPGSRGMFECFREAWCLMACHRDPRPRRGIAINQYCNPDDTSAESPCPLLHQNSDGRGTSRIRHATP